MIQRSLKLTQGKRSSLPNLIDALAGVPGAATSTAEDPCHEDNDSVSRLSPKDSAICSILQKSFLQPQKGKAREYCSLGHKMELPNLKHWVQASCNSSDTQSPGFDGVEVEDVYTVGLAARKRAEYAKDSIDFLMIVLDDKFSEHEDDVCFWGFEAKGRLTPATAAKEEKKRSCPSKVHKRIRYNDVYSEVDAVGKRFQVLQHAYVYSLQTVVLSMNDRQAQPIRSLIIDFVPGDLREDFGQVLKDLYKLTLKWAYPMRSPQCPKLQRYPMTSWRLPTPSSR